MPAGVAYSECERLFFSRLEGLGFTPKTVLDIGGSNGAWSGVINTVYPSARFELFEPLAGRRDDYDKVLAWVRDNRPNFRVHSIALGETNGEADFWHETNAVGSSLLASNFPANQCIKVPVRRLDDYLIERQIPQPEVIKADVQGGELQIIKGGRRTFELADVLHIETWLTRTYGPQTPLLPEIMETLRPLGHVMVQLGEFWRADSQEIQAIDAFFIHKRLIDRLKSQGGDFPWPANWTP